MFGRAASFLTESCHSFLRIKGNTFAKGCFQTHSSSMHFKQISMQHQQQTNNAEKLSIGHKPNHMHSMHGRISQQTEEIKVEMVP